MTRILPFLALMLAGCYEGYVTRLGPQITRAAVPPDSVLVYRTPDQVPGRFTEIAIVTVNGWPDILKETRKRAGALGANAVILIERPTHATVTSGYGPTVAEVTSGAHRAVAIVIER